MMQQNNLRDEIHFKSYQVVVIFIVCHTLHLQRYKYIMKNGKWKKRHRKKESLRRFTISYRVASIM